MSTTTERKPLTKARHGERVNGCTDTAAPEQYTQAELSRLYDAMYYAEQAGIDRTVVFAAAPTDMRMEYIYSNWIYRAE